jgi:hypothetical protein
MTYHADPKYTGRLPCPVPGCPTEHKDGCMFWRHFRDLHYFDRVIAPKEGSTLPDASTALCRLTPHTHTTSGQRNAKSELTYGFSGNLQSPLPLPYDMNSLSKGLCLTELRCSNTSAGFSHRTTMIRRPSGSRYGRLEEYGPA